MDCTGKELEHSLDEVHITANKNTVPGETAQPVCDQRRARGHPRRDHPRHGPRRDEDHRGLHRGLHLRLCEGKKDEVAARVAELVKKFPLYE